MSHFLAALRPIPGALSHELRSLSLHDRRARESLKVVLSVLLAVTVASLLRLDDLSWAAFSGYMVMRADVTETTLRGLMRIVGTAGGALLGLLLAPAVADAPPLLMAALFAVSWIGIYQALASRFSYAWLFFGLTAGLVLTDVLAAPATVLHFAGTRVAEIVVGTGACLLVANLFAVDTAMGSTALRPVPPGRGDSGLRPALSEAWLREHWPLITHTTRAALAVALLPLVWRWFEIEDFAQTAVTSYVVMIVPAAVVRERRHVTIYERIAHRTLGCLLGSATAIACLSLFGDDFLVAVLTLCAGIWIGSHVQGGCEGISYLGTQFVLGFLVTFVQGPGPVASILPGLERLVGILIGSAVLYLLILLWPLADDA